jgi:hypothetical protein
MSPAGGAPLARHWLIAVGAGHVVIGIAMPLLLATRFGDDYLTHLWRAFYAGAPPDAATHALVRWLIVLLGAMIAGWGILIAGLAHVAVLRRTRGPIEVLLIALLVWAALDIGWGLHAGVMLHVIVDTLALVAIVPALLILRAHLPRTSG